MNFPPIPLLSSTAPPVELPPFSLFQGGGCLFSRSYPGRALFPPPSFATEGFSALFLIIDDSPSVVVSEDFHEARTVPSPDLCARSSRISPLVPMFVDRRSPNLPVPPLLRSKTLGRFFLILVSFFSRRSSLQIYRAPRRRLHLIEC